MKRTTWGVLVLLLGSGGCISFYPEPPPEKEKREVRVPGPSPTTWTARDGERTDKPLPSRFTGVDSARTALPPAPVPVSGSTTSTPAVARTAPAAMPTVTTAGKVASATPPPPPAPATTASLASATQQVSYVTSEPVRESAVVMPKPEGKAPPKGVTVVTPTKADAANKAVTADHTRGGKGAPPLMRMVNS